MPLATASRGIMSDYLAFVLWKGWIAALWFTLVLLSVVLIAYPKHLIMEYAPVQSLRVFPNLWLFGGLYYAWFAGLVAILFFPRRFGSVSVWEGSVVASLFALVNRGMWDILLPDWWADGLSNIVTSQFIIDSGRIFQSNPNIAYLDFPGLHILAASLAQLTGIDVFSTASILLLLLDLLTALLLYLICLEILRETRLAALAALLGMLGNVLFAVFFFYPGFSGLVLLSAFILVLIKHAPSMAVSHWSLALILLAGVTVTHFVSSVAFGFVLLSTFTIGYLARWLRIPATTVVFSGVVPAAWLIHYTRLTFYNLTVMGSHVLRELTENPLYWIATVARANFGGNEPTWVTATKLFWLVAIYGLGTLSILLYAFRLKTLETPSRVAISAFLGLTALSLAAVLLSVGGFEFFRFLTFAPLFTAAFLVLFLRDSTHFWSKAGPLALLLITIVLSLPTFLAHRPRVEQYAYYPHEYAVGRFIFSTGGDGRLQVYSLGFSHLPVLRYNAHARFWTEGLANLSLRSEVGLWEGVAELLVGFQSHGLKEGQSVFLYSDRPKVYYQHIFQINPRSRMWLQLEERLSRTNLAYDSGHAKVYAR